MSDEKSLKKHESMVPSIPDDKLDAVIDLSDDQTSWVKVIEGGFKVINQDKFVKGFTGRIMDVTPYLMKFENGVSIPGDSAMPIRLIPPSCSDPLRHPIPEHSATP